MPVECATMGLIFAIALAQTDSTTPPASAPAIPSGNNVEKKNNVSSESMLELLEFLGSWETATGSWSESLPDEKSSVTSPDPIRSSP